MDDEVRGEASHVLERWLAARSALEAGAARTGSAHAPGSGGPRDEDPDDDGPDDDELVPAVREALVALRSAQRSRERREKLPANVGKPWSADHDAALLAAFDAGLGLEAIAAQLHRTRTGIRTRLERHGRLTPAPPA
jgi:hypothetical protein